MYRISSISWRMIILMTSFNFVSKYEIRTFPFIDTLNRCDIMSSFYPVFVLARLSLGKQAIGITNNRYLGYQWVPMGTFHVLSSYFQMSRTSWREIVVGKLQIVLKMFLPFFVCKQYTVKVFKQSFILKESCARSH